MPTSLLQTQQAKENKHTRRATMQVNNRTAACTPGGRGWQEKETVEEKGDEEGTEGKREAGRDTKHSLNDARQDDIGGGLKGEAEE